MLRDGLGELGREENRKVDARECEVSCTAVEADVLFPAVKAGESGGAEAGAVGGVTFLAAERRRVSFRAPK